MLSPLVIPTVSMDDILQRNNDQEAFQVASKQLVAAFETDGLAYLHFGKRTVTNFEQVINPAFQNARNFFSRPLYEKTIATPKSLPLGVTRGYLPTNAESGGDALESKEAFSWSLDLSTETETPPDGLEHPNIWPCPPGQASGIDEVLKKSCDELFNFLHSVMCALARALQPEFPSTDLLALCERGASISLLRSFHYHAQAARLPNATGSSPHTDWGFATLVAQEEGSTALHALAQGNWRSIPARHHSLTVNCSDFLTLLSHGRFQSPKHRVVLTDQQRFSFVYFQYPPFDQPFPSLVNTPEAVLNKVSLLTDQRKGASGRLSVATTEEGLPSSFGTFIARKWVQVARSIL